MSKNGNLLHLFFRLRFVLQFFSPIYRVSIKEVLFKSVIFVEK